MKRGLVLAAAAILIGGAAASNPFVSSSQASRSPLSAIDQTKAPSAEPRAKPDVQHHAGTAPQKASLEVRQAPVPLQVAPRRPVVVPTVDTSEAYARGEAGNAVAGVASRAADRPRDTVARLAIETDGYQRVQIVRQGDNGVWHATAFRGQTKVALIVDSNGNVSTDD